MKQVSFITLIGISVLIINNSLSAQPFFSDTYDLVYGEELIYDQLLRSSVVTDEGTYFYQGKTTNYGDRVLTEEIGITFLKDNEDVQWQKVFNEKNGSLSSLRINDGITDARDGIAFIANNHDSTDYKKKYSVVFVGSDGAQQKRYTYSSPNITFVRAIDRGPNGKYYITGYEIYDTVVNVKKWRIFLSIIDEQGNELYHRNYNPRNFSDHAGDKLQIECTDSGDIYICVSSGDAIELKLWLLRLDSLGNKKWKYATENTTNSINDYVKMDIDEKYGRIYLSWHSDYRDVSIPYFFYDQPKNLIALDTAGNKLWKRDFKTDYGSYLNDLTVTDDGDILVCGSDRDRKDGDIYYGWLARLDKSGKILWQKYILENDHRADETGGMNFSEVQELDDGSILLGGNIIDTVGRGDFNQNAWIVRLDSAGNCSGNDCPEIYESNEITSVTDHIDEIEVVTIFPNPASTEFLLKFPQKLSGRLSMVDMRGTTVKKINIVNKRQLKVMCSEVPSGVYNVFITMNDKNQQFSQRIIIQ